MKAIHAVITILGGLFVSQLAYPQGRIVVVDSPQRTIAQVVQLKQVYATVNLTRGVGEVTLEQTFYNQSARRLEGEYLFSLQDEGEIHDFNLYINGKKTGGELLDKSQAADIYEDIVRSMRDPALLEYAGYRLFKARIFPIEPKDNRKIELSYAQVVSPEAGTFRFVLPIRQSGQATIEKFEARIRITTEHNLGNVYSPSHEIEVQRRGSKEAEVTFKARNLEADKDFLLFYTLADQEISTTLLTFRPRTDRDGYFMLLGAPTFRATKQKPLAKDVVFVIDASGSMAGEKMSQAREALRYCVNSLNRQDKFEIIRFSSTIESFQDRLQWAGADAIENAHYFIDNLRAAGGTNIDNALQQAVGLKSAKDNRPTSIVFLTDGLPTEGETDIKKILENLSKNKADFIRIFIFGVGNDVNTYLLDKIAGDSHGSANYVRPGESIEKEVSVFFAKHAAPVLTHPEVGFGKTKVADVYPQRLPDIFQGQRVTVIGRYRNAGAAEITLSGMQGETQVDFSFASTFPRREMDNEFIAKLWANRKVAHLLNEIRFNGENKELVDTIKSLGREYGIVTPYTSYLVREQEKELFLAEHAFTPSAQRLQSQGYRRAEADDEDLSSTAALSLLATERRGANKAIGKASVETSMLMDQLASSTRSKDMILTVKKIGARTFHLKGGIWIEGEVSLDRRPDETIIFLSDPYFALSRRSAELRRVLALGEEVLFVWEKRIYRVTAG